MRHGADPYPAERFAALQAEFAAQLQEEAELNATILANLKKVAP